MARAAMAVCGISEVWFLVNPDPGHKRDVSSLVDRLAMVRLAVAEEPRMREGEPGDHGVRPHTMHEFEALMARHSEHDFVFIVGAEVLEGIEFWDDAAAVVKRAEFAAVRRPGQKGVEAAAIDADLAVEWFEMDEYAEVSSGQVKRALLAGQLAELPDAVRNYIEEKALYKG